MKTESSIQNLELFKLPPNFRGKSKFICQLWWIIQDTLFRLSPQFLYGWRKWLLKLFGAKIGHNVLIRPTARITYPWKLTIGDNSWIGDFVELYNLDEIIIGKNVVISQKSYICTGSHNYRLPSFDIFAKKIIIEDEVWIATDVFVAPGVKIEKGSVIGARSSVFNNVEENSIYIGSPAKFYKRRKV